MAVVAIKIWSQVVQCNEDMAACSMLLPVISIGIIYLRNKETQQALRVIESIQYDASFKCKRYLSIGEVCVRQITAGST